MPTKFGRHPGVRDTQTHRHTQVITIPSPPLQKGAGAHKHTQVITIVAHLYRKVREQTVTAETVNKHEAENIENTENAT